ncbi:MAG: hypothetical protein HGA19_19005, partial [Oscillochloris sp.]|nr:hypothetical protein [Oscillochloris sp.]
MELLRSSHANPQRPIWWLIIVIVLIAMGIAYQHALQVSFLSDDHAMLAFAQMTPISGSVFMVEPIHWLSFHRPLGLLVWQLMYRIWGLYPLPYHVLSLVLHTLNSLLIIRLVSLIEPTRLWPAIGAGLFFALYPIHTEAVVWLSCWFDLLALCLYLSTLIFLIYSWQHKQIRWFLLSVGLYQLAVWSKESAFTLPAMIVVVSFFLVPRPPIKWLILHSIPYCLILTINLIQRYLAWGSIGGYTLQGYNLWHSLWDVTVSLLNILFAPLNRDVIPLEAVQITGLLIGVVVLIGLVLGVQRRLALFGLIWFGLTLIPVFNLLPIRTNLQDARLLYPVAAGYCVVVAVALEGWSASVPERYRTRVQIGLIGSLSLAMIVAIQIQVQPWVVATKASDTIIAQIEQALPSVRLGSVLEVVNLPDSYHGAYIYRNGLEAALLTRKHQLYIDWKENPIKPFFYADFFEVQIASDEQKQRWGVSQVRGVTINTPLPALPASHWIYAMHSESLLKQLTEQPPAARPVIQSWDSTNCQQVQQWLTMNLKLDCHSGSETVVTPETDDPMLILPGVEFQTNRWTEVVVTLETQSALPTRPPPRSTQATTQIYWGSRASGLDESHSMSIRLPETPGR